MGSTLLCKKYCTKEGARHHAIENSLKFMNDWGICDYKILIF